MSVLVLWGGELSQGIAERIVSEGSARSPPIVMECKSMEGFRKPALKALVASDATIIMVMQTVENDEPPESAGGVLRFFKMKSHPVDMLATVCFTVRLLLAGGPKWSMQPFSNSRHGLARCVLPQVLALGDSNLLLDRQTTTAKDCNKCGQLLDARMGDLGGTRFYPRGEADERTSLQEVAAHFLVSGRRACMWGS